MRNLKTNIYFLITILLLAAASLSACSSENAATALESAQASDEEDIIIIGNNENVSDAENNPETETISNTKDNTEPETVSNTKDNTKTESIPNTKDNTETESISNIKDNTETETISDTENNLKAESTSDTENNLKAESTSDTENNHASESISDTESSSSSEAVKNQNDSNTEKETASSDDKRLLSLCGSASQLITVEASGSSAVLTVYDRLPDDTFEQVLSTNARIGKNGIGKTKEGDKKTPSGTYHFTMAFGKKPNPGAQISYTQITPNHVWVDDPASPHYNQFVDASITTQDWSSAEKLYIDGSTYSYALALDYNPQCIPNVGSAIFLHCLPTAGYGCIAIPEDVMRTLLPMLRPDCVIAIY